MLETFLEWMGAGDKAIATMGPVMSIALAALGGSGITQALKFPLVELLPDKWENWAIRLMAMGWTWLLLHWLADLPPALEVIVAAAQPYAYTGVMAVLRHRWPWLEATRTAGSARPSDEAQTALEQRRAGQ